MIRMRIPTQNDYKSMASILKKYSINEKEFISNEKQVFIMIEKNKVIGLSKYQPFEKYGVIDFIGYDIDFLDNSYRDAFFRGTLNLIMNNGLFKAIVLTTKENHNFYETYGFDSVEETSVEELKEENIYTSEIIGGFKIDIERFFNRPCSS